MAGVGWQDAGSRQDRLSCRDRLSPATGEGHSQTASGRRQHRCTVPSRRTRTIIPRVDAESAAIENAHGRVRDPKTGGLLPGVDTVSRAKRGPIVIISTNERCAEGTVNHPLDDLATSRLPAPCAPSNALLATLCQRGRQPVTSPEWNAIDQPERRIRETQRRPRVTLVRHDELLARAPSAAAGQPREE